MEEPMFLITNIESKIPIAVVSLDKLLDALNSQVLQNQVNELLPRISRFVFDCSKMDFIDSAGLGAVVTNLRKAEEDGGGLIMAGLGP